MYTDNFSDKKILGQGGSTPVYKGNRQGYYGTFAVKKVQQEPTRSEFHSELEALKIVCHQSLLSLVVKSFLPKNCSINNLINLL